MRIFIHIIFVLLLLSNFAAAQPELDLKPNKVEFENIFERQQVASFFNKGDQPLSIDSLVYNTSLFFIRPSVGGTFPLIILPDDTINVDVILMGYFNVTVNDTLDTVKIYNNGINNPENLRVRIKFFDDDLEGTVQGNISDTTGPLVSANVYFFFNGLYLIDSVKTDTGGNYSIALPEGTFTIAAEKPGYFLSFYDNKYDPNFAVPVTVDSGIISNIDFILQQKPSTGFTISGSVIDSITVIGVSKGIIVARKGKHTPTKLSTADSITGGVYAAVIDKDGNYSISDIESSGYYFIQASSSFYLPGYYNENNFAVNFWEDADSVFVNTQVPNTNVFLARDSSYGGGNALGSIILNSSNKDSFFEGISLYARNINNQQLYTYNFAKEDGQFKITNIPYGTYHIVADKFEGVSAFSNNFVISAVSPDVSNITIDYTITKLERQNLMPDKIQLLPNYPNPFNPETTIEFSLAASAQINLRVYNTLGELIATLADKDFAKGNYKLVFNANNLASGVYLVVLESDNISISRKILLLK